jgi:hypothetical protein
VPTVAEIEREVAGRTGPFRRFAVAASPASTIGVVYSTAVQSAAEQGGWEGLWLLRRGLMTDGTPVAGFVASDRQRIVAGHDPVVGSLSVDLAYTNAPVAGEEFELLLLDPANELRVCVQRGLDRCFARDRVLVVLPTFSAERDVTLSLPWLTRLPQLVGAADLPLGSAYGPAPVDWWNPFEQDGHVFLGVSPDPYPNSFWLSVLRPVSSRINGLSVPPCPILSDVPTGGVLLANTVYNAALAVQTPAGTTPACPVVRLFTATDGANTHAARFQIPPAAGARNYLLYLSLSAVAAPLRVATISETQRAAGVSVTAQDTISAVSPGAGLVDVQVTGTGAPAVQAAPPSLDADVLDVPLDYAATAAHAYAWERFADRLQPVAQTGLHTSKSDVRRAWKAWIDRLPRVPDRPQLAVPWPASWDDGYWDPV